MKIKCLIFSIISIFLVSCATVKPESEPEIIEPAAPVPEENISQTEEIQEVEEIEETPVEEEVEDVEVIEEPQQEEDVEVVEEALPSEEYLRSIGEIETEDEISQEEFEDDKATILQIISELSTIMEEKDTNAWLKYIDPESKKYYSNPANLRKAQKKLPNRLILLKNIGDYFKNVFIPARQISCVDEIRYISKTEVKAVEVKDDGSIIVYYFFKKINDKWYVNLPPI